MRLLAASSRSASLAWLVACDRVNTPPLVRPQCCQCTAAATDLEDIKPRQEISDWGYDYRTRGWYDVQVSCLLPEFSCYGGCAVGKSYFFSVFGCPTLEWSADGTSMHHPRCSCCSARGSPTTIAAGWAQARECPTSGSHAHWPEVRRSTQPPACTPSLP